MKEISGLPRESSQTHDQFDQEHSFTYPVKMTKNITLAIDEKVLKRVRRIAAERDTTVNGLVRDYLTRLADFDNKAKKARTELIRLAKASKAEVGPITWKREDLYER
ncbi:MAG: hypothetical protein F9K44_04440 [Hyphomicrobiaceae bacterium]|nr:MAG: hypothetical protein F9K44_04440 [Hyphomicrobiaceae bacterium]